MQSYELTHLSNAALLHDLEALAVRESVATALLLAHVAEADARRLYAPAGYPSMFAYCVEKLHLSEDAAYYRIRAARTARQFPVIFDAVAEGRLHLTAVCLLAPHLTAENAGELIEAATHRRKAEIEELVAGRFHGGAKPARVAAVRALPRLTPEVETTLMGDLLAPDRVEAPHPEPMGSPELVPARVAAREPDDQPVPARVDSGQRFLVQVAISKSTHDKLCRVQALLSHAVPEKDLAQVLDRALDALIATLEKRKLGAAAHGSVSTNGRLRSTSTNGRRLLGTPGERHTENPTGLRPARYIPAPIRRAVWERDAGQCTFVSPAGQRCTARSFLEFDHVEPVARGGRATVETIRLRCRVHNQYEAERTFGAEFMKRKREEGRVRLSARARSNRGR